LNILLLLVAVEGELAVVEVVVLVDFAQAPAML
jgi:hypothetical protein